jgi:hypothetical protein
MNELEFRKRCIINPDDREPDFLDALEKDDFRRIHNECINFDSKLSAALKVPAPEGLQDRILAANREPSFFARWKKKLMALSSLIATMILGLTLLLRPQVAVSEMVFEHLYHDMGVMHSRDVIQEAEVDRIMQLFDGELQQEMVGTVRFVNDCEFMDDKKGVHLVYDGEQGPVTVFYIPHRKVERMQAIAKNEYQGILFPHHKGSMAIIGLMGENMMDHRKKVESAIHWNSTQSGSDRG